MALHQVSAACLLQCPAPTYPLQNASEQFKGETTIRELKLSLSLYSNNV